MPTVGPIAAAPSLAGAAEESAAPGLLRAQLKRRARRGRLQALLLVAPLLLFLVLAFLLPIALLLARAVDNREVGNVLPGTAAALAGWSGERLPDDGTFSTLAADLAAARREQVAEVARRLNYYQPGFRTLLLRTARIADEIDPGTAKGDLLAADPRWGELAYWRALKQATPAVTPFYLLAALDLQQDVAGRIRPLVEDRLYVEVLVRTLSISLAVTLLCLLLGYPLAYFLASAGPRASGWLVLLVLLPFWTSLLVRTTAWLVLLQSGGLVNTLLTGLGLIGRPLDLVHNRTGVMIAMTHILLPFMILPILAVMRRIPPTYMRAAASLGAPPWRAFLRVYLPQTLPGVGAGCLLVFILALGYYITPALLGGPRDQMLSYFVAYFVNQSTNWGMAAALSTILLAIVVLLYALLAAAVGSGRVRLR